MTKGQKTEGRSQNQSSDFCPLPSVFCLLSVRRDAIQILHCRILDGIAVAEERLFVDWHFHRGLDAFAFDMDIAVRV